MCKPETKQCSVCAMPVIITDDDDDLLPLCFQHYVQLVGCPSLTQPVDGV